MKMAVVTRGLLPGIIIALLAGCASQGGPNPKSGNEHSAHHPGTTGAVSSPAKPSPQSNAIPGAQGGMMGMMDMTSMCDMHRNMMSAKSPAERDAMMDQNMKSMSPETRRQHMEMMQSKCK